MTAPLAYIDRIAALGACSDAVEWLRAAAHPDLASAWAACQRGDWMLWLAARLSGPPWSDARRPLVLAACACAREALPAFTACYPADLRPRHALDTAAAWCRGDATQDEVLAAQRAAAYVAASAASAFAADAAAAAAGIAYAAAAANTAAAAAADAAYAAYAYTAARSVALARSADIVRQHLPCPVLP